MVDCDEIDPSPKENTRLLSHLWRNKNDYMALLALLLAIIGVIPVIWDAFLAEKRAQIFVRYDPFAAYIPGELTGPSLNPIIAKGGVSARSRLPRLPIRVTDLAGNLVEGDV